MSNKFEFKINGIQISTTHQLLTAIEILTLASEKGAIPGNPHGYILKGSKRDYQNQEEVDLREDNLFITVPDKATQVAEAV